MKKRRIRLCALLLSTCLTVSSFSPVMAASENGQQATDTAASTVIDNTETTDEEEGSADLTDEADVQVTVTPQPSETPAAEPTPEEPTPEAPTEDVTTDGIVGPSAITDEILPAQDGTTHTTDPTLATSWTSAVLPTNVTAYFLYASEDGDEFCKGETTFGDVTYYFDEAGILLTGKLDYNGQDTFFMTPELATKNNAEDPEAATPWNSNMGQQMKNYLLNDGTDTYFYGEDGVMVKNGIGTDPITKKAYYFGTDGKAVKKVGWYAVGDKWYYLNADYSVKINELITVNKLIYYMGSDGTMQKGFVTIGSNMYYFVDFGNAKTNGWFRVDGKWYYAQTAGVLQRGWLIEKGKYYYMNPTTRAMATGWVKIEEQVNATTTRTYYYFMNSSGEMQTNQWRLSSKRWYYVGKDGRMATGWMKIKGLWYYLDPDKEGAMATGWVPYYSKWCWCNSSGAMVTNRWLYIDKAYYYAGNDGIMQTGWKYIGKKWYYLGNDGSGKMLTGWQKVNNKWYYMNSSGAMLTAGWHKINNQWYYMNSSGAMLSGWQRIGNKWYYLNGPESGVMVSNKWQRINNQWYYFYASGAMAADAYIEDTDGTISYVNASGAKVTGNALQAAIAKAMTEAGVKNSMTAYQKLRACYDYLLEDCDYEASNKNPVSGWATTYATEMLTDKEGDNYHFSAAFGQMARAIGYKDMKIVRGRVPSSNGKTVAHSWCDLNGKLYDPIYELSTNGRIKCFNINYSATGMTYTEEAEY